MTEKTTITVRLAPAVQAGSDDSIQITAHGPSHLLTKTDALRVASFWDTHGDPADRSTVRWFSGSGIALAFAPADGPVDLQEWPAADFDADFGHGHRGEAYLLGDFPYPTLQTTRR